MPSFIESVCAQAPCDARNIATAKKILLAEIMLKPLSVCAAKASLDYRCGGLARPTEPMNFAKPSSNQRCHTN
jgi:hypothetical protein